MKNTVIYITSCFIVYGSLIAQAPDTLWSRIHDITPDIDEGKCIRETTDGGYIITGMTSSGFGGDLWLAKLGQGSTGIIETDKRSLITDRILRQNIPNPFNTETSIFKNFVFVKGGSFNMGNTFTEKIDAPHPVKRVKVSDFYISKYEVTQKEWEEIMGYNPCERSPFTQSLAEDLPVHHVSWLEAIEFCNKKNRMNWAYMI
jgi:formylglycine-generating enzyme required for sulfatase activity